MLIIIAIPAKAFNKNACDWLAGHLAVGAALIEGDAMNGTIAISDGGPSIVTGAGTILASSWSSLTLARTGVEIEVIESMVFVFGAIST